MIKYRVEFSEHLENVFLQGIGANLSNRTIRIDFSDDAHIGAITNLNFAGATYSLLNENQEKDTPIIPTELFTTVTITDTTLYDYLIGIEEDTLKAEIYIDSVAFWSGYVGGDELQRPHYDFPQTLTFRASDRLAYLKTVPYPVNGRISGLDILHTCLTLTGAGVGYSIGGNIFELTMNETSSTFEQANFDTAVFVEDNGEAKSCYDVLWFLMRRFDCRLMQDSNEWRVDRVDEVKDSARINYTFDSALVSTGSVSAHPENTFDIDFLYINETQILKSIPGWKNAILRQRFGINSLDFNNKNFESWTDVNTINDWSQASPPGSITQDANVPFSGDFAVKIVTPPIIADPLYQISQTAGTVSTPFKFQFYIRWNNPENKIGNKARFSLRVGTNDLQSLAPSGVGTWLASTPAVIEVTPQSENSWTPISMDLTPPASGAITITFYNGVYAGGPNGAQPWEMSYDNVILELIDPLEEVIGEDYEVVNDTRVFSKEGFDEEMVIGDVPIGSGYTGAIRIGSTGSTLWNLRGLVKDRSLNNVTMQRIMNEHYKSLSVISCEVMGEINPCGSVIDNALGKEFIIMSGTWDMPSGQWGLELEELTGDALSFSAKSTFVMDT